GGNLNHEFGNVGGQGASIGSAAARENYSPSVSQGTTSKAVVQPTRQSDPKDYGKDRDLRSMITAGIAAQSCCVWLFGVRFLTAKKKNENGHVYRQTLSWSTSQR
ncbi:hypothetical protein Tco_0384690, partial [Tanacetum coccineum]